MLNIRKATANDCNQYINLTNSFVREYKASGETTRKSKRKTIKQHFAKLLDQLYMITDNGNTVGFVNLKKFRNESTQATGYFIHTMYIYPGMRGKGLAKRVRQQLIAQGIKGTIISYGRASRNIDYFVDCGFTAITEYPAQVGSDIALCLLLVRPLGDAKPLTANGVKQSRADAWRKAELYAKSVA